LSPTAIPPGALEGIILDLMSVAESPREKGDEVNAAVIDMVALTRRAVDEVLGPCVASRQAI
jgi:hypothetical protein